MFTSAVSAEISAQREFNESTIMPSPSDHIKISLFGAAGRMGSEVAAVLTDEPGFHLVNLIEHASHPAVGASVGGIKIFGSPEGLPLAGTIFCDFTLPDAVVKNAALAAELKCPLLIGATGFTAQQQQLLENLGDKIPVMIAPNLSRGINLLNQLIELAASKLAGSFEVEVVETHHKMKQDAPSGTAKNIVGIIKNAGIPDVPAHSLRIGDVTGEHQVIFGGVGESIQIIHRAQSRRAFASGVIPAARFLASAAPGCYSFSDALNSR